MEPLKTATLWGMENWPSYGGGRLIEVKYIQLKYIQLLKKRFILSGKYILYIYFTVAIQIWNL